MRNIHFFSIMIPLSILVLSGILQSAGTVEKTSLFEKNKNIYSDTTALGKQLALKYCTTCHIFTEPTLLDKKMWTNSVLPNMGMRLGIKNAGKNPYSDLSLEDSTLLKDAGIYPDSPIISKEEWVEIIKYYEKEAPSVLSAQKSGAPIIAQLAQFKVQYLTLTKKKVPKTTLLKFDKSAHTLYVGDTQNELYMADSAFKLTNIFTLKTPATDMDFPKNKSPRLLTIGSIKPSDQKLGKLTSLDTASKTTNFENLQRPVQFAASDLNNDGKEDVLIAQFGHNTGKLSWFDNGNSTKEHILKAASGTRKIEIADFNGDKKPDIMVLMAQANEEITIFYNQGKGKFKEKTVLRFPPVYGVSYFELADFNKDGFQDILLTNGDNWDYSAIEKPYHGIRIYLNDGKDNFKEAYFYPLFGTSKAMARDFDNDGDLDIAAISFYADLAQPEQSFIYLQNEGGSHFKTFSTPEAAAGKWLTMEVGDFDKDGDVDIALGSYFHTVGEMTKLLFRGIESFPQLLILKNQKF
jgi:FG-GAP-like repeat